MPAQYPYELHDALRILGWVGPRRIVYRGKLVDGSRRSEAARTAHLCLPLESITHATQSKREAARLLIMAGHYSRAGSLGLFPFDPRDFTSCLSWAGLPKPRQAIPGKVVHAPKVRADAIRAIVSIIERTEERGDDAVPLCDLKAIVARWMI